MYWRYFLSWPGPGRAAFVMITALVPMAGVAVAAATDRLLRALSALAAVVEGGALWTAMRFENSVCPNMYADTCRDRALVDVAYLAAVFLPMILAGLAVGLTRERIAVPSH